MARLILALVVVACGAAPTRYTATTVQAADPDALSDLLARYVIPGGGVDYATWKAHPNDVAALDRYLGGLTAASPDSDPGRFASAVAQLSYWINLYNAVVVREVLRRWPLESVRDVRTTLTSHLIAGKGFFYDLKFVVAGKTMNLRDLENAVIRRRYADARIHFAINCASASCPVLSVDSFQPGDLDARLELATIAFVNQPANLTVDSARRKIRLSKIFEWYDDDFVRHARDHRLGNGRAIDFVAHYARGALADQLATAITQRFAIEYVEYDWSINASRGEPSWGTRGTRSPRGELTTSLPELIGKPLPPIAKLADLSGAPFDLATLRGRPLVIELWASHCRPCRSQLPKLVELASQRSDVAVVAISLDESPDAALATLRDIAIDPAGPIRFAIDRGQSLMGPPLSVRALPAMIIVDGSGTVQQSLDPPATPR